VLLYSLRLTIFVSNYKKAKTKRRQVNRRLCEREEEKKVDRARVKQGMEDIRPVRNDWAVKRCGSENKSI
jgi:hypothetical protein